MSEEFDTSEIDTLTEQELIELFNDTLYDLLKQLKSLVKSDEDIAYAYGAYKDLIRFQQKIIIDGFIQYVSDYFQKIKEKDENYFLNLDTIDTMNEKYKGELDDKSKQSVVMKVFKFKKLFKELSKKDKDMLFYYLNILRYISCRYFLMSQK